MKEQLANIKSEALAAIAGSETTAALDGVRVKYLGKKGELTAVLKQMGKLSAEERPVIGQIANEVRETLTQAIAAQHTRLEEKALAGRRDAGRLHPRQENSAGPQAPHHHHHRRDEGHLPGHGLHRGRGP